MDKIPISEIAQELGMEIKDILTKAKEINFSAKTANCTVDLTDAEILANYILTGVKPKKLVTTVIKEEVTQKEIIPSIVTNETISEEIRKQAVNNNSSKHYILININQDSYIEDSFDKLNESLSKLLKKTDIEEYFKKITDSFSDWSQTFYISNLSLDESNEPYLLFRPKMRPKIEDYFDKDLVVGFKVKLKERGGKYLPLMIDRFEKLVDSEKREWEQEIEINIFHTKNEPNNLNYKNIITSEFIQTLPLISKITKEKLALWNSYLEWKQSIELSMAKCNLIKQVDKNRNKIVIQIDGNVPKKIIKDNQNYGVYIFDKQSITIEKIDKNNKVFERPRYIGKEPLIDNKHFFKRFECNNKEITIENGRIEKDANYVIFVENNFTTFKQKNNIEKFQSQGGYAPFLSSYLFDITKARLPKDNTQIEYFNEELTEEQKLAIDTMLNSPDIALIQGPPGTGKTTIIAECIYQLIKQGKKVMLTSESNDAVDNALDRLFEEPEVIPLRLTSSYREDESMYSKENVTKKYFDTLSLPARDQLKLISDKHEKKQKSEKDLKDLRSYVEQIKNEKTYLQKEETEKSKAQKIIDELERKKEEIEIQSNENKNLEKLIKKINEGNNHYFGKLNIEVLDYFYHEVIIKIDDNLSGSYFDKRWNNTLDNRDMNIVSHWLNDGLDKYFQIKKIYKDAKNDLEFLKQIITENIIREENKYKIKEIEEQLKEAEQKDDTESYRSLSNELGKLQRDKGLKVDVYIDCLEYYILHFEKNNTMQEIEEVNNIIDLKNYEEKLKLFQQNKEVLAIILKLLTDLNTKIDKLQKIKDDIREEVKELNDINMDKLSNESAFERNEKQKLGVITSIKSLKSDIKNYYENQKNNQGFLSSFIGEINSLLFNEKAKNTKLEKYYSKKEQLEKENKEFLEKIEMLISRKENNIQRRKELDDQEANLYNECNKLIVEIRKIQLDQVTNILTPLNIQNSKKITKDIYDKKNSFEKKINGIKSRLKKSQKIKKQYNDQSIEKVTKQKKLLEAEKSKLDTINFNSEESRKEYLEDKIGSKSKRDDVIKILEYFIDIFQKKNKNIQNCLGNFITVSEDYLQKNKPERFTPDNLKTLDKKKDDLILIGENISKYNTNHQKLDLKLKKLLPEIRNNLNIDKCTTPENIIKHIQNQPEETQVNDNQKIIESILGKWVENIDSHKPIDREKETYLKHVNVVGITLNASEKYLRDIDLEYFDVVIIDEISKATPPEYLMGMLRAKKSILVGDHRQLPPLFSYQNEESCFEDVMHDEENNQALTLENFNKYKRMVTASQFQDYFIKADSRIKYGLKKQFRMHTDIMDIVNCFYGGTLSQGLSPEKDEHNKQKQHNINIKNFIAYKDHAIWVDTNRLFNDKYNLQKQDGTSKSNLFEAFLTIEALIKIDNDLYEQHKDNSESEKLTLGIISFYSGQVRLLMKMMKDIELKYFDKKDKDNFMISTVDSFQGRDRDIILVNLISTKSRVGKSNFVSSFERINVAFSRAKKLLIIFGSKTIFDNYEVPIPDIDDETQINKKKVYREISTIIKKNGCGRVPLDICEESSWEKVAKAMGEKNNVK